MEKKIFTLINNYVSKIFKVDRDNKTLDEKLISIDKLTDDLIDFCIKNNIVYIIEHKISYSSIIYNFKLHLVKFLKNLIDPTGKILNKYIVNDEVDKNWDNISDVNTLLFKNFKNLNETFEKNVTFTDNNCSTIHYSTQINESTKLDALNNLSLYIKLLFNQQKFIVEFIDKITVMCTILTNNDGKYKKINPYD